MKKSVIKSKRKQNMIVRCDSCKSRIDCEVVGSYKPTYEDEPVEITLLRCRECDNPIVTSQMLNFPDEPWIIYPIDDYDVKGYPIEIRDIIQEAYRCFKNETYIASTILCRKVLEGIYLLKGDQRFRKKNLYEKLDKLKDSGVIDTHLFEWANLLREKGNVAAHDVFVRFTMQDAQDLMDFTHALCEYVFILKDKFDAFKNRRGI